MNEAFIYLVLCLKKSLEVDGMETEISREKGFTGYLPVFRTLKYAEKFAGKKFSVIPIQVKKGG